MVLNISNAFERVWHADLQLVMVYLPNYELVFLVIFQQNIGDSE